MNRLDSKRKYKTAKHIGPRGGNIFSSGFFSQVSSLSIGLFRQISFQTKTNVFWTLGDVNTKTNWKKAKSTIPSEGEWPRSLSVVSLHFFATSFVRGSVWLLMESDHGHKLSHFECFLGEGMLHTLHVRVYNQVLICNACMNAEEYDTYWTIPSHPKDNSWAFRFNTCKYRSMCTCTNHIHDTEMPTLGS